MSKRMLTTLAGLTSLFVIGAGAVGGVASGATSSDATVSGGADASALVEQITLYDAIRFVDGATQSIGAGCVTVDAARSAELGSTTTKTVELWQDATCGDDGGVVVAVLSPTNPEDSGDPTFVESPGSPLLGQLGARSYRIAPTP